MEGVVVVDVTPGVVVALSGVENVGSEEDGVVVANPGELGVDVNPLGTLEDESVEVREPDVAGEPGAVTPGGIAGLGVNIVPGAVDGESVVGADALKLELPILDRIDVVLGLIGAL